MKLFCALLCLLPAMALADGKIDLKYKIIVSHDDFLAALECKAGHYRYFKRISKDNVICIRDIDTDIMNNGGSHLVDLYIRQHVKAMQRRVSGDR